MRQNIWLFLALVTIVIAAILIVPGRLIVGAGNYLWHKSIKIRMKARLMDWTPPVGQGGK